ncbi:S-isoprenylcysteine methyltransferase-like protein [Nitrosococcus halophilus Nc 4]|uniref:S-isoprenylcysteine methyltransferase-like protein n=1 Tax=Nitrosococcus halophilus (strain Nc4) TaxID=472759 RepID=D5C4H6_NITHN|nr:isoprenylcysteine carboxylmethyltransferase family protein [Nitrosococcus halophilus]ADE15160.1 S-isoprenylcysteine methyltransferase-like protein [Nitrosococcus halophilus Nc 4]
MSVSEIIILGTYGLMLVELIFLPVPSEASTYQLLFSRQIQEPRLSGALLQAHRMPIGHKLWVFLLPTSLTVIAFFLPLLQIFFPQLKGSLLAIPFFENSLFRGLAIALIIVGSLITLISVLEMRSGMKKHALKQTWPQLQVEGVFCWSRNPGLVGNYGWFLGLFFYFPSWVMALGFGIYLFNMHRRVLLEESQLAARFGETYRAYQRRVPRYLGFG